MYNIKDFGAVGDGRNDTAAIQAAADLCRENGGGCIFIPVGEYEVTSVRLYSNTTLIIEQGARLLLDAQEENFEKRRGRYDTQIKRDAKSLLRAKDGETLTYNKKLHLEVLRFRTDTMFYAEEAENITIEGGTLDGRYPLFYDCGAQKQLDTQAPRWSRSESERFLFKLFRPHMMAFRKCKNLTLKNTRIINGPFFNIRILDCDTVLCENLSILTDKRCVNTDGINIGASKHCRIQGCHIVAGDDCIALSVGESLIQESDCEDIIIRDCSGDTNTNFVRIFSGIEVDGCYMRGICGVDALNAARKQKVSNVLVSDCVVSDGGAIVNIISVFGAIENIEIRNIQSHQTTGSPAAFIAIQNEGSIKNVTVDGVDCKAKGIATILGTTRESISGIKFRNCNFYIEPKTKLFGNGMIDPLIHYWVQDMAPYNFYLRHVTDVTVENCIAQWGEADLDDVMEIADLDKIPQEYRKLWREDMNPGDKFPCVSAFDVKNLTLDHFQCTGFNGCEPVKAESTDNLSIIG